jgi:hypothetical protein
MLLLVIRSYYVRRLPSILHRVEVTFCATALPPAASVRDPVDPAAPTSTRVSVVIDIVNAPADISFSNVMIVPTGYATEAFAGIVHVRAVVSAEG